MVSTCLHGFFEYLELALTFIPVSYHTFGSLGPGLFPPVTAAPRPPSTQLIKQGGHLADAALMLMVVYEGKPKSK